MSRGFKKRPNASRPASALNEVRGGSMAAFSPRGAAASTLFAVLAHGEALEVVELELDEIVDPDREPLAARERQGHERERRRADREAAEEAVLGRSHEQHDDDEEAREEGRREVHEAPRVALVAREREAARGAALGERVPAREDPPAPALRAEAVDAAGHGSSKLREHARS